MAASLAAAILGAAVLTGTIGHEIPVRVAAWGSFGWPALVAGRWWTLVTSLVLTRDPFMAITMPLAVATALGTYERMAGHARAFVAAGVGHLTASVLVALGAGALGRTGWPVAVRAAENLDYGASMVVAAALGAIASRRPRLAGVIAAGVVAALLLHHQMADWAHLVAAPTGFLADRARAPRRALVALAMTALLTGWLTLDGWRAVVQTTDTVRFASLNRPLAAPGPLPHGSVVRLTYRSPALRQRVMVAWVYLPPEPHGRLPVALFLHDVPGVPDDWLSGGALASSLDRAIAQGSFPPALVVVPDGEGMHDPRAGWADVAHQHLLAAISRDLLTAVARRWPVDLGPGQVAAVGVGRGGRGAARLSRRDTRIGFVAALGSPARVRRGVHLLIEPSTGRAPGLHWQRWRADLPALLDWLRAQGFGLEAPA